MIGTIDTKSDSGAWLCAMPYSFATCASCGSALCAHTDADFLNDCSDRIAQRDRLAADVSTFHSSPSSDEGPHDHGA